MDIFLIIYKEANQSTFKLLTSGFIHHRLVVLFNPTIIVVENILKDQGFGLRVKIIVVFKLLPISWFMYDSLWLTQKLIALNSHFASRQAPCFTYAHLMAHRHLLDGIHVLNQNVFCLELTNRERHSKLDAKW